VPVFTAANAVKVTINVRAKAIPLETWTGLEGSRRLRLPNFKTIGILRW
jgi:hypothetical protein